MRIAHFAPFAPNRCGLYEAARDFVRADRKAGRVAELVDVGASIGNERAAPQPGANDARGGNEIVARAFGECAEYDLFVAHDGIPDAWLAQTTTPVVVMIHGRPAACFRPEQWGRGSGYSFVARLAQWPRVRKLVTMWREFVPFWETIVPPEKLVSTDDPPIDCEMYRPDAPTFALPREQRGECNVLISESWREDVDIFEVTQGVIEAARQLPREMGVKPGWLKVHFFAVENDKGKVVSAWEYLFAALRNLNALGIVNGRFGGDMGEIYRATDIILSPHHIATRSIGEALACGRPVIGAPGCRYTSYTANWNVPADVAHNVIELARALQDTPAAVRAQARVMATSSFGLERFGEKLGAIYEAALGGEVATRTTGAAIAAA